jgi:hypothetical protein
MTCLKVAHGPSLQCLIVTENNKHNFIGGNMKKINVIALGALIVLGADKSLAQTTIRTSNGTEVVGTISYDGRYYTGGPINEPRTGTTTVYYQGPNPPSPGTYGPNAVYLPESQNPNRVTTLPNHTVIVPPGSREEFLEITSRPYVGTNWEDEGWPTETVGGGLLSSQSLQAAYQSLLGAGQAANMARITLGLDVIQRGVLTELSDYYSAFCSGGGGAICSEIQNNLNEYAQLLYGSTSPTGGVGADVGGTVAIGPVDNSISGNQSQTASGTSTVSASGQSRSDGAGLASVNVIEPVVIVRLDLIERTELEPDPGQVGEVLPVDDHGRPQITPTTIHMPTTGDNPGSTRGSTASAGGRDATELGAGLGIAGGLSGAMNNLCRGSASFTFMTNCMRQNTQGREAEIAADSSISDAIQATCAQEADEQHPQFAICSWFDSRIINFAPAWREP